MRGLHWFRNDLRLDDNTALNALLARATQWLPVFVLDPRLVADPQRGEPRTCFMLDCLMSLHADLKSRGIPLIIRMGQPEKELPRLMHETGASLLAFNEDVTPFARRRDAAVRHAVEKIGGEIISCVDHVIYAADEISTNSGGFYAVYTPYRRKWWNRWVEDARTPVSLSRLPPPIPGFSASTPPDPLEFGRESRGCALPSGGEVAASRRLEEFLESGARSYHEDRDRPDRDGTSRMSAYLRFGVISPRRCFERGEAAAHADPALEIGVGKWLDELIWREFYSSILERNPRVLRENFRREYDCVPWCDDPRGFESWCEGYTGYPIVDAGMRQLRATGWMHNRLRMIVASFLTKDLMIDWREGERWFFECLVDGDPASNNGGWQWAASTGTDAQPYFRIFNPITQGKRWDPEGRYVRRWLPELASVPDRYVHEPWKAKLPDGYPPPILDHAERRALTLERFRCARNNRVQS